MSLMWQHVSPLKGRRQDGGIIYIRGNVRNFNYVKTHLSFTNLLNVFRTVKTGNTYKIPVPSGHQYLQPAFQNEEKKLGQPTQHKTPKTNP